MVTFLDNLKKPIIALAPMDGITDIPFRLITLKYSNPSFVYTEFVPTEGLIRGIEASLNLLKYENSERPIIAQLYGKTPLHFYISAQIVAELGFDGIDINMGCPARRIEQHGSGGSLIKDFNLAGEIINAVKLGIKNWQKNGVEYDKIPFVKKIDNIKNLVKKLKVKNTILSDISISVKTRTGYNQVQTKDWIEYLSKFNLDMIALHGRTLKQQYRGKADWNEINIANQIIKDKSPDTKFLGNGDIKNYNEALEKIKKYNLDGVLVARATIGNPWFFKKSFKVTRQEIFSAMIKHAEFFTKYYPNQEFFKLRKIFVKYVSGLDNATELRRKLVTVHNMDDLKNILKNIDKSI